MGAAWAGVAGEGRAKNKSPRPMSRLVLSMIEGLTVQRGGGLGCILSLIELS